MLRIREITSDEFSLVWPIFQDRSSRVGTRLCTRRRRPSRKRRRIWSAPPTRAFVAERDGVVVGSYMLRPNQPGLGDHVANAGYVVAPEARNQGIARALCQHSLATAAEAGFTAMQFNFSGRDERRARCICGHRADSRPLVAFPAPSVMRQLGLVDVLVMYRWLGPGKPSPRP